MNQKDPGTYFDEWLTAYSDHLHMVRRGAGVDFVQSTVPAPLSVSTENNDTATTQRKPTPNF